MVVARAWRWDEERLRHDAEVDHADQLANGVSTPDYSVSVFAQLGDDPNDPDVRAALMQKMRDAPLRSRWVSFTTSDRLADAGFLIRLNEPPPAHHDVVLGTVLAPDDVVQLASIFGEYERQKFQ